MKTLFVTAFCALLAGCASYGAPNEASTVVVTRDSMRTYRPLPLEERRVSMCTMRGRGVYCR